ncbi:hypothetical protein GGF50DRAFT_46542, partial [Schizophyllum commune]
GSEELRWGARPGRRLETSDDHCDAHAPLDAGPLITGPRDGREWPKARRPRPLFSPSSTTTWVQVRLTLSLCTTMVYSMMDIDGQASPHPLRAMRSFSAGAKRARSPDSEDPPTDRPVKRIATDNDAPASRPIVQLHIGGSGSNRGSRQSSEEWPNRMGGLRIDSPMVSSGAPSENGEDDAMDVAMDAMPSSPSPHIGQNSAFASSAPSLSMSSNAAARPAFLAVPSAQGMPGIVDNVTGTPHRQGPQIQITPATPMSSFQGPGTLPQGLGISPQGPGIPSQPTPAPPERASSVDIAMSPSPSRPPATPSFQRRFTMGPRLDCEKCRLGVKGHYAHYT